MFNISGLQWCSVITLNNGSQFLFWANFFLLSQKFSYNSTWVWTFVLVSFLLCMFVHTIVTVLCWQYLCYARVVTPFLLFCQTFGCFVQLCSTWRCQAFNWCSECKCTSSTIMKGQTHCGGTLLLLEFMGSICGYFQFFGALYIMAEESGISYFSIFL